MRPGLRPEGLLEHVALWGNLGPLPVGEAMFGMASSRVLMAGARLGIYAEIAAGQRTTAQVAGALGLDQHGVELLLDCLCAMGHVRKATGEAVAPTYVLSRRARPWLTPGVPDYIGPFLEFNYDQWEWWSGLEQVVRTGQGYEIHDYSPDDPRWERYIRAMYCLARLSAPEVAKKLRVPADATRLLDLAGGHGWFSAELCRRHAGLQATVLDLPGSTRVGREIIAENAMGDRVEHVDGDMFSSDLGGPYDGALCFQIVHHLTPEQNIALLRRVRNALKPGGIVAVMDYFAPEAGRRPDSASFLGLHFFLTSSATTYTSEDLKTWLKQAGFSRPRKVRLLRVPVQTVFEAKRLD